MTGTSQPAARLESSICVAKVGGSLLTGAELPSLLQAWLKTQQSRHTVLVAGGGELVEVIRTADRTHNLGDSASHWLAIAAMQVSARLLAKLVPQATLVESWSELRERVAGPGVTIFAVEQFLKKAELNLPGTKLPESWDVTSDSIAARLAITLQASELVLLKSAPLRNPAATLSELAANGYVDRFLPSLEKELPAVRCVGLLPAARQPGERPV